MTNQPEAYWYGAGEGIEVKVVDASVVGDDCFPLLDWKGLEENGQLLPYSIENAKRILQKYPYFAQFVFALTDDPSLEKAIDGFYGTLKRRLDAEKEENLNDLGKGYITGV